MNAEWVLLVGCICAAVYFLCEALGTARMLRDMKRKRKVIHDLWFGEDDELGGDD